jgi:glycosyltransferase involved in cell wall biosynthesis
MTHRNRGLVVVPVYNEENSLDHVVRQVMQRDLRSDALFINDGSTDGSAARLESLGCDIVNHVVNLGYQEALRTGLEHAWAEGYGFVAFFDGDGQHRVEDLNRLIEHHYANPSDDLLIGSRYQSGERAASMLRHIVSQSYAWCVRLTTRQDVHDVTCGLKLLNRSAMQVMRGLVLEDGHAEFFVFMGRAGIRMRELPIHVEKRRTGVSMYRLPKMLLYPLKTSFLMVLAMLSRTSSRGVGSRR